MSRRFSEEEARRIFARAAERQAHAAPDAGLTLADLQEAAGAAGLDPALVAMAAAELDSHAPPPRRVAGSPVEAVATRVVPGTLDDDTWAAMVGAARAQYGRAGTAGQVGARREWTLVSGGAKNGVTTHLAAEPVPGGIRLSLSQSIRDMAVGFTIATAIHILLAVIFGGMAAAGVDPELWIPATMMASFALLFGGGLGIGTRLWHRHRTAGFETLLDRLELATRASAGPLPHAVASERPTLGEHPSLDLDASELAPDEPIRSRGRERL